MTPESLFSDATISGVLAKAWQIYKKHWKTILVTILIIYVPINLLVVLLPGPQSQEIEPIDGFDGLIEFYDTYNSNAYIDAYNTWDLGQTVGGLVGLIAVIGVMIIVKSELEGKEINYKEALKQGLNNWPAVFGTNLLLAICLFGLMILFVIPGVIYSIYWIFTLYVVVFYKKTGKEAMDYSKLIIKERWWKTLGFSLVFGLLALIPVIIVMLPFILNPTSALMYFISNVLLVYIMSFFYVVSVVFFVAFDATKTAKPKYETSYKNK